MPYGDAPKLKNKLPPIRLSEDATARLVGVIEEMIEEAEEFHSDWESLHDEYMNMYLCVPDSATKDYPWSGASNLFLPLTRVMVDGILAQEHDAMFANDPSIKVSAMKSSTLAAADRLTMFYGEYVWKSVLNLKLLASDHLFDNAVDGTAAFKARWNRDRCLRRRMSITEEPTTLNVDVGDLFGVKVKTEVPGPPRPVAIEDIYEYTEERPQVDVVDMARIYVAPDTTDSLQWPRCRWYYQESYLTWDDLKRRERDYGYDNITPELRAAMGSRELTDAERSKQDTESLGEAQQTKTAQVLEIYMRYPLPCTYTALDGAKVDQLSNTDDYEGEAAHWEEIVVTYLCDTDMIARIVPLARVSPNSRRPHIDNRFSRLPRFFYGMGIPAKMRFIQAMMNSSFNQMMDYGTLQNIPFYFFEPATTGLMPDLSALRPGMGYPVLNSRGVTFPRFNTDTSFWQQVSQIGQAWAERDGNINDYSLGRAPSTPNAPRTARGQSMMQQQNNIGFGRLVGQHSHAIVELLRYVDDLYAANAPDELVFQVTDQVSGSFEKAKLSRSDLAQEKDFQYILNPNRQAEQQMYQSVFNIMASLPAIQQNPMSTRELARQFYESMGLKNFEKIWPSDNPYNIAALPENVTAPEVLQAATPPQPGMLPMDPSMDPSMGGMDPSMMGQMGGMMPDLSGLMGPQMGFDTEPQPVDDPPPPPTPTEDELNVDFIQ